MSFLFYTPGQVLHEFLQVEAFAKLSNAIGKVGSLNEKSLINTISGLLLDILEHNGP